MWTRFQPSIAEALPNADRAPLRVLLLGPPAVEWAGETLPISRRQVRALLYRLAAARDPIPREHLCFLFWPDIPETAARRKLTGLLAHLRHALPAPDVLQTPDDHVGLDPENAWSELLVFKQLCNGQAPAARLEALHQAVELYRGSFLAGFSLPENPEYETWITIQRQTCERLYLEALATLIEEYATSGDPSLAIDYAQRYLETDELAEDIHRSLIQLYAASGDRSAAIRQFEQCVTVLERELGVDPLPETQAAYQTALDNRTPQPVAAAVTPSWTTLPGLDVDLVGREEAMRQLKAVWAGVRSGQGGMVLISGEPGIGKSRLMQEFAVGLGDRALILTGAGYRDAQARPYQPVVEALRPAVAAYYASLQLPACCLAETSRLMPELRLLYPDLPPPMRAGTEQSRAELFEALSRIVLGLGTHRRPLLLCLDNLHWADGTTLDWLAHLGRRLRGGQVLVVATYRDEQAGAVSELRRGLARQGLLVELALPRLDETSVERMLRAVGEPFRDDKALPRQLARLTGGNPFFLLETVRAVLEAGCSLEDLSDPAAPCLPDTVRDTVEARVARLSPKARQVLEAGAVLGQSFSLGLVQRTSGRREMETMDGLDELVARHLLEEGDTGYWFHHEIIWAAVYGQLSHWRRQVLHRRAGEALERLEPGNAAALARHFEQAEKPGTAARYALRAGRAAKEVFAHAEARAFFERALALLQWEAVDLQEADARAANQRLQVDVLYERGWALRLVGEMETYASDLEQVARLADALGDPRVLAHLRWRQAYTHRWFCRFAEAGAAASDGVRLSLEAGDRLLESMCRREVGLAARAAGHYRQAREALEGALDIFVDLGEKVHQIHTIGNLATLCWYEGEYEAALSLSRRALALCDEAGLALQRRLPLGDMGAAAVALGAVDLAREWLEESLAIARETADRTQEILCLVHLGWLDVRLKRPAEALERLQAGLDLAERIGSCAEQSWLLSGLAQALRLAGHSAGAVDHARRALAMAQKTGAAYDQRLAQRTLDKLDATQ